MAGFQLMLFLAALFYTVEPSNSVPDKNVRIVGGEPTTIEQFPYQVSVMYIDTHMCGGSLIHTQYVLTAAHCFIDFLPKYLLVRAGSTYIDQKGHVEQVSHIYQHPGYENVTQDNDVSILKVKRPFELGDAIQLIPLPLQNDTIGDNKKGVITGWGRLSNKGLIPLELQQLTVPIIDMEVCVGLNDGKITEHMFCAGYVEGGKDACLGDSGGPLVVEGTLTGITSWGVGCALPDHPGVYVKVSSFVDYINSIVYNEN